MDWIYTLISWILLRWHTIWSGLFGDKVWLATNWDWVLAIVFLVITVRVILFPLFVKQIKSQRAMQKLQPQVKALQEKHKGDREGFQKEVMELYRREKANPLMGCLPLLLQIPVFFGLFHILRRVDPDQTVNTDLYGWTHAQFHDAALAKLFAAPISQSFSTGGTTVKIVAGVLVLIMIVTTYLTSKQMILKTGWSEDPQQRLIQKLMLYGIPASLLISGFLYPFPIGVVIYWTTTNLFSLGQQFWVLRKYPPPQMATVTTSGKPTGSGGRTAAPAKPSAFSRLVGRLRPGGAPAAGAAATTPTAATKALAPKVGAKPVNPKKAAPRPATGAQDTAAQDDAARDDAARANGGTAAKAGSPAKDGATGDGATPSADGARPAGGGARSAGGAAKRQPAAKQAGAKQTPAKQTPAKQTGAKKPAQKRAKRPTG
jgi:YidC/Oxa1 family membrane protein insertase